MRNGGHRQEESAVFDLEQVKTLASAIRSRVFWAFDGAEPQSASQVGAALGKSAQTVHYHINELTRVGLLIPAGTRKRRARTEQLYLHAARRFFSAGPSAPAEYRAFLQKGFEAITREMARENAALHRVLSDVPFLGSFQGYRRISVRLSEESAAAVKRKLYDLLNELREQPEAQDGVRVNISVYLAPTQAESRRLKPRGTPTSARKRKR
jgi:biotin operon repressor